MDDATHSRDDLEIAALTFIASQSGPAGSLRLREALEEAGIVVSEATAGRFLRVLDRAGSTEPVGTTRGRVITAAGEARLEALLRDRRRRSLGAGLLEAGGADDVGALLDVLRVRRVLEPEAVRLAARHAPDAVLATLAGAADRHIASVGGGGDTADDSMSFHELVAEASGNPVLATVTALLLDLSRQGPADLLDRLVFEAGHPLRFAHDHREIARLLRERRGDEAEAAMRRHLEAMIAVVETHRAAVCADVAGGHEPAG